MSTAQQLSIAVASFPNKRELEGAIVALEVMHRISIDKEKLLGLWRDVQRTPKSRAL